MTGALESIAGLRIFIVEDETLIVEEMADRLTRAGCKIIWTPDDGKGAIEAAVTLRPDLDLDGCATERPRTRSR
jgi:AmiR/NasT family two-component response regulator